VEGCWADADGDVRCVFGVGFADEARILTALRRPQTRALVEVLDAAHDAGATLLASCSSTFLLAETGRLAGGPATTSWWLAPLFRRRYPAIDLQAEQLVTEHERLLCAGAAMAQLDLVLHLVRRVCGMEVARLCARYLVLDEPRPSQAPYLLADHLGGHDEVVAAAQGWIRRHLREATVHDLAKAVAVSPRTLRRRFVQATGMAPRAYIARIRAEVAADLLRTTELPVARIAEEVGYAEDGALRRTFQQHLGMSPQSWRQRG
jgi:transcriptional regulator GlxA family with amidase domain